VNDLKVILKGVSQKLLLSLLLIIGFLGYGVYLVVAANVAIDTTNAEFISSTNIRDAQTNNTNTNLSNLTFPFNYTGNNSIGNCSIFINGVRNTTNATIPNATRTNFTLFTFPEGVYTWNISCQNASENASGAVGYINAGRYNFTVDTTAPTEPTPVSPATTQVGNLTPTFDWTTSTELNFQNYTLEIHKFGNLSPVNFTFNISKRADSNITLDPSTINLTPNENISWRVFAYDTAGNPSNVSIINFSYITDTIGPTNPIHENITVGSTNYPNGSYLNASFLTVVLNWTTITEVNFGNYTIRIADINNFTYVNQSYNLTSGYSSNSTARSDSNFTPINLPNGTWYWLVNVSDQVNRMNFTQNVTNFVIDTILPGEPTPNTPATTQVGNLSPKFDWATSTEVNFDNYTIEITSVRNFSPINYTFNVSGRTDSNFTINPAEFNLTPDLNWSWRVRAYDKANNANESVANFSYITDTIGPSEPSFENISAPNLSGVIRQNYPNDSYFNASFLNVTLNWTSVTEVNFGNYTIRIADIHNFTYINQSYNITNGSNASSSTGNSNFTPINLPNGTWYWLVNVSDQVGRTNATVSRTRFTIDTILPTMPTPSTPTNQSRVRDNTTNLNWTISTDRALDNYTIDVSTSATFATINFTFNHTRQNESNITLDTELPQDPTVDNITYYWRVRAYDKAGNVNISSTFVLYMDGSTPGASAGSPIGSITDDTPTVSVTSTENATCKYDLNQNKAYGDMAYTFSGAGTRTHTRTHESLGTGVYDVYVRCIDIATNIAPQSYTYEFTLESSSAGGGGSGGGGGGSGTKVVEKPTDKKTVSTPRQSPEVPVVESGQTLDLGILTSSGRTLGAKQGSTVTVDVDGTSYSVGIVSVSGETVTMSVGGQDVSVGVGGSSNVDVDGNGEIDLVVYLAGVSEDGVAEVTLKAPSQEITLEEASLAWVWWIVVLAVIVVAVAYFVMHRKKASKRRY